MPNESPQQRLSAEDRRKQLIEVAIDLFSRRGFSGTTTKEIAAAAGVTEAIIFRHFATKQDFYKAILDSKCRNTGSDDWLSEIQAFMDSDNDEGLFRFLLSKIVEFNREDPGFARLLLHAALEGHELALMHHNQLALPVRTKLTEYIVRRQASGAIRKCDPSVAILALAGIAQHYAMQKYVYQCGTPQNSDDQMIEGFLTVLVDGLRPAPGKGKLK